MLPLVLLSATRVLLTATFVPWFLLASIPVRALITLYCDYLFICLSLLLGLKVLEGRSSIRYTRAKTECLGCLSSHGEVTFLLLLEVTVGRSPVSLVAASPLPLMSPGLLGTLRASHGVPHSGWVCDTAFVSPWWGSAQVSQQVQDPLGTVLLPLFQHVGPSGQAFLLPNRRHYGRSEGERGTKWNDFG